MTSPEAVNPEEQAIEQRFVERHGHLIVPKPALYKGIGMTATALFGLSGGINATGTENLPTPNQAGIVAATHDSMIGVVALCEAVRRQNIQMHNMAKNSFWRLPVIGGAFGKLIAAGGAFPVDRNKDISKQPEVIAHIDTIAEHSGIIDIFPQGTRKNHERGQVDRKTLKSTVAFIALKWGLPITPAAGTDTFTFNHVNFGPQMLVDQVDFDLGNVRELVEVRREHANPLLDELYERLHEAQTTAHADRIEAIGRAPLPRLLKQKLFL